MIKNKDRVPTSTEYAAALDRYVKNMKATASIISKSEAKIAKEMAARHEKLGDTPQQMESDYDIVKRYCLGHKELLFGQSKTLAFKDGQIKLHAGQFSVDMGETQPDELIAALKKKSLNQYVVESETLDKKKLITDRDDKELLKVLAKFNVTIEQNESVKIAVN